jgi:hypothetical protein
VEGAVAAVEQGKKLLAVEVAAIRHLGPIVTEAHDGVVGSESSGKCDIDLREKPLDGTIVSR